LHVHPPHTPLTALSGVFSVTIEVVTPICLVLSQAIYNAQNGNLEIHRGGTIFTSSCASMCNVQLIGCQVRDLLLVLPKNFIVTPHTLI